MPRERFAYRENLQDILEFSGGRRLLSIKDVGEYIGISKYSAIKKRFPFKDNKISAPTLAKCLSVECRQ